MSAPDGEIHEYSHTEADRIERVVGQACACGFMAEAGNAEKAHELLEAHITERMEARP